MKQVLVLIVLGLIKVASANDIEIEQNGDDFELSVLQSSSDNLLRGSVIGNDHAVSVDQSGGATAEFTVENSSGSVNLDIHQNDSSDSISVTKICTDPAGCAIRIDQR